MSEPSLMPIRTWAVNVRGFPEGLYSARSRGKAQARAWRDYASTFNAATFLDFMKISSVRLAPNPHGVGERIMVAGSPATRVIGYGQYVHYMRDDSDVILCSHPLDVSPLPSPPTDGEG